ncbi:MAG: AMP-binding protein [Deltaproteobacteria bacterium]|nr:AMP-binding protein [Deltaproteobacteria bacterium]
MLPWLDQEFLARLQSLGELEQEPQRAKLAARLAFWRVQKLAQTLLAALETAFYKDAPNLKELTQTLARAINALEGSSESFWIRLLNQTLSQLPLTEPAAVAETPELFLAVSQSDVAGVVTVPTSGSTGQAKRIYSTVADLENTEDFYYFGMRNIVDPGQNDRVALLMSGTRPGSVGDMLGRALGRWPIEFSVPGFPPLGREEFWGWYQELLAWEPTCLVGVPAQVLALARHDLGRQLAQTVRAVLLSGDVAPKGLFRAIEEELPKAKVFLHYGQTEFGLGGAVECRFHLGPHFREADIILEILGPNGQSLPPGEIGEMVLTSLSRQAMPLIRYRTGDLGAWAVGVCPCGSIFRRIKTYGRVVDQVVWRDGQKEPFWKISEILYSLPGVVGFKALAPEEPDDCLKLIVNVKDGPDKATEASLSELFKGRKWAISYEDASSVKGQATGKQILHKSAT